MPYYVFAKFATEKGLRATGDGPFETPEQAEEFAMKLKNPMEHPAVVFHPSIQLSEAKRANRHLLFADSGDISQVPDRQYSANRPNPADVFRVEESIHKEA